MGSSSKFGIRNPCTIGEIGLRVRIIPLLLKKQLLFKNLRKLGNKSWLKVKDDPFMLR
jgi:hypothetical protein